MEKVPLTDHPPGPKLRVSLDQIEQAAVNCYSALKIVIGCVALFFTWEEMMVEGGTTKCPLFIHFANA